ncbi:Uncharacterized protein RNJ44_02778 [Nakaseomyces bracarensis]|uniref:C2H2-type domain-containing protein n=1 Tax=Nakaseomyces bracarensis TaxID=273131 RepID=A0ABR4P0A5_9SACH
MEFDLQNILLDQFLDVSNPVVDLKLNKDEKDLVSSPPSFTVDNLDLSSLNFDMSSNNTTTSNTTVATPNEISNNMPTEGIFDLNFDFGNSNVASNIAPREEEETTSPLTMHNHNDCCAKAEDLDLNNLLNLNIDMFLSASSPASSTTPSMSMTSTRNGSLAATPLSNLSKKRSKSLTTTQLNRTSSVSIPKIRGRKPSLHYDDAKVFKCEMCERRFKRQEHLKRHVSSLHMGERPYSCEICLKSFSRSDNLSQHKRTHSNVKGVNAPKRNSSTTLSSRSVSSRL